MTFDKWFNSQSRLLKVLLLILPVVGWIVECLIRLSDHAEDKKSRAYRNLPAFLLVGWTWLLCIVDLIYLIITGLCSLRSNLIPPVGHSAGGNDWSRSLFSRERLFFTFRFPAFSLPVRGAPALSSLLRFPVFYVSVPLLFPVFYVSRPFALHSFRVFCLYYITVACVSRK